MDNESTETLRARLETLLAESRCAQSHSTNARTNLLSSARMCSVVLAPDFTVRALRNHSPILGPRPTGIPVEELVGNCEARAFFESIRELHKRLPELARDESSPPWSLAYPTEAERESGLMEWQSLPDGSWETAPEWARTSQRQSGGIEMYLVSAREIVGAGEDFKIEYDAQSDLEYPRDLSVIVGTRVQPGSWDLDAFRPDRRGYGFAFGAMDNFVTEIQRSGEALVENRDIRVVPGRLHHCVAERLGGVLRFSVDGRVCCSAVDWLPLMEPGAGHVGLYSCGPNQVFRNLQVWTRPTCLPPDMLRLMASLRGTVLGVPNAPARFVKIDYLRPFRFLLQDVTAVVEQRQELEGRRHEAEKLEALVHLANGAAHELNQPLTLLTGYLDLILQAPSRHQCTPVSEEELAAFKEATNRMTAIVEKIQTLRAYRTRTYLGESRILDLDASSDQTVSSHPLPPQAAGA